MGGTPSCCQSPRAIACPTEISIQCQQNFLDTCDGVNNICTTFNQTDPGSGIQRICFAQGNTTCCRPSSAGTPFGGPLGGTAVEAWKWDDRTNNCAQLGVCADVDVGRCITLGTSDFPVPPNGACAGNLGDNIASNKSSSIPVTCRWPITAFNSLEAIKKWQAAFPEFTTDPTVRNVFDTQIMPHFCSIPLMDTTGNIVCPTSNNQGSNVWKLGICSPMVATNDAGDECRKWLREVETTPEIIGIFNGEVAFGYCTFVANEAKKLPTLGLDEGEVNECLCINHGKNPKGEYAMALNAVIEQDSKDVNDFGAVGCWYAPCNVGINQLIPLKDTQTEPKYHPDCPNVCLIINNIKGIVKGNKFIENIDCKDRDGTGNGNGNGNGDGTGNGNGDGTGNGTGEKKSFWDRYRWYIIAGSIVLVVIVFIIIIFVFLGEEGKKKKEESGFLF